MSANTLPPPRAIPHLLIVCPQVYVRNPPQTAQLTFKARIDKLAITG